jgi:hypothetical protein
MKYIPENKCVENLFNQHDFGIEEMKIVFWCTLWMFELGKYQYRKKLANIEEISIRIE